MPIDPTPPARLTPRATVSLDELLGGVTSREPMKTAESLSSATFEKVVIDGEPYIVKYLHCDDDWIMRATGDVRCRPWVLWSSGLFDALPPCIDATVAGCATGLGHNGWGVALLMHDVGELLIPDGDDLVAAEHHQQFLENMAALHAHFWDFDDPVGLLPPANRFFVLSPWTAAAEAELGSGEPIPRMVGEGWAALPSVSPRAGGIAHELLRDPSPLLCALDATPQTLVHGDWKLGNLGLHPDGRSIVLDWAFPGASPGGADLAWYLGVNCARMPIAKEDAIATYKRALEAHGVSTDGWWDQQLALSLLGHFLQMGWHKALVGRDAEFEWWEARVLDAERYLA
jgi:hypothetical protein